MSWAAERRTLILTIIGLVVIAALAVMLIALIYEAPSCNDGKQNQEEEGIDCGGTCTYLCSALVPAPVPTVSFVRALALPNGRTDVIAYVENKNPTAAIEDARFIIELFSSDRTLVATQSGTIDLPPATDVPIFVPNFFSGNQEVAQAFLSFDETTLKWMKHEPVPVTLVAKDTFISGAATPRVTAMIVNSSALPAASVKVVATVYDASGNVIAASQTLIPQISGFSEVPAVFTWNTPFSATPARIDVQPITVLIP